MDVYVPGTEKRSSLSDPCTRAPLTDVTSPVVNILNESKYALSETAPVVTNDFGTGRNLSLVQPLKFLVRSFVTPLGTTKHFRPESVNTSPVAIVPISVMDVGTDIDSRLTRYLRELRCKCVIPLPNSIFVTFRALTSPAALLFCKNPEFAPLYPILTVVPSDTAISMT